MKNCFLLYVSLRVNFTSRHSRDNPSLILHKPQLTIPNAFFDGNITMKTSEKEQEIARIINADTTQHWNLSE